jgi:phosphoheptose isomerase
MPDIPISDVLPYTAGEPRLRDPRHLNQRFDVSSIGAYLCDYADHLRAALLTVDAAALDRARLLIDEAAQSGRRIYAIGNGGSTAIADHLCCDLTKGTHAHGHPVIDTTSMTSNVALYSAIANDFGFEHVFSTQISFVGRAGDLLIAISSSGKSPNILAGIEAAHAAGMATIGLSGFTGGALARTAQVSLHVDASNYGIVEDVHQALMHVLAQFLACGRDG